jgi:hypothetical protein
VLQGFDPMGETQVHKFHEKAERSIAKMEARYARERASGMFDTQPAIGSVHYVFIMCSLCVHYVFIMCSLWDHYGIIMGS